MVNHQFDGEVARKGGRLKMVCPDFPDLSRTGLPRCTLDNYRVLLDFLGVSCRYNLISGQIEMNVPHKGTQLDNALNSQLAFVRSEAAKYELPDTSLDSFLLALADQNPLNPVLDWIQSIPWDKVDRIPIVLDSLEVREDDIQWRNTIVLRWLFGCVGLLRNDDGQLSAEGTLTFQGEQGVGKTRWFHQLGGGVVDRYLASGVTLNPTNKDSVMLVTSNWLVELGELDGTFAKSQMAHLKAFLTNGLDRYRRPYAKTETHSPRRTSFFASVNDPHFLADATGNRRFWCLKVLKCHVVEVDWQQFWAQILELVLLAEESGLEQPWRLNPEEKAMLAVRNQEFQLTDFVKETLVEAFCTKQKSNQFILASARQVCDLLGLQERWAVKVGKYLSAMEFEQRRGANRQWRLPRPPNIHDQKLSFLGIKTELA